LFLEQPKENTMRRITLLLFQLFLGIFAAYAVLYDVPNEYLIVPLICLVCMYFLGRHPEASPKRAQEKVAVDT
jgi:peptidoglycan/LPS O-acetylase OafA/YrhL